MKRLIALIESALRCTLTAWCLSLYFGSAIAYRFVLSGVMAAGGTP